MQSGNLRSRILNLCCALSQLPSRYPFMAFLAEVGAERDDGQQAKTRWALEHAVHHYRQARDPKP